jgi:hypothetical protein
MSSLTGQSSSTKSLTGLSDTYSTNIVCDTLEVADEFTCDPGCVITLPPASIQDSYLTANVAFRNQVNNFTLANNFASTTTNNGTSNFNSTMNVNNGTIQNFFSTGGTSNSRIQQTSSGLQLVNGTSSQTIGLYTRTSLGVVGANLICQNGNTCYMQGDPANRILVTASTTPTLTIQAPLSSNNFSIVNTAWVVSQAFAKLAGPQTFTGDQNFPTQATSDNSTLVATTAFVKNQNYITAAALTPYALLAPPSGQTFTGLNNFPTQLTTDNSTLVATTAYVKNNLLDYGRLTLATGATLQTWFGSNRFSSNSSNLPISLRNTDASTYGGGMFICSGSGQFNATNQVGDVSLLSTGTGSGTGALSLTTWSSTNCGIRIGSSNITHNGTNHFFNGNISLGLYNLDILNSARTRGLRISNNGANNGTTDIEGVGVSTRFNFFSSDGTGTRLNNLFISNGNTCYLQGATGLGIGMIGSAISLDGVCSFTNTTTPVITQSISLADNSTKIATTAYVRGQNYITSSALTPYALLNPTTTQTFAGTGDNVFSNIATFNVGLQSNNNITLFSIGGGGQTSNIQQNNSGLTIRNIANSNSIILETRTSGGVAVENIKCQNGNQNLVRGSINMLNDGIVFNDIGGGASSTSMYQTGTNCSITSNFNSGSVSLYTRTSGGVSVENLKCSNGIDTTIRGTLTMLNEKIDMNANPIKFVDGLTSSQISQSGNALIIKNISNVNSVQIRSTTAGLVERTGITVQNGNETIIQGGSAGIIRVFGNDATIECDNFKSNAPFECGYLQLGTPITTKTNYDIGYQWSIQGSSFNSWSGFTAFGTVVSIPWNGTSNSGNTTLGVWLCDICIATNTTSAMDSGFVLNITNNFVINTRSAWSNALTSFGVNQAQIVRLSTVLNITTLTDTYYLNFKINGGSARTDVPGASQMLFTRIA